MSNRQESRDALQAGDRPGLLLVSITPFFGGGERYYAKLCRLLAEKYSVTLIASNDELLRLVADARVALMNTQSQHSSRLWRYLLTAVALIRARWTSPRAAAVHLNGQGEAYLAPLARLLGWPVMITRHTLPGAEPSAWKRRIAGWTYGLAARVICVSEAIRRDLDTCVRSTRAVVIPNWLAAEQCRARRAERFDPDAPFRLLYVGRLIAAKGVPELMQAMERLPHCTLDIVGEGELFPQIAAAADSAAITAHGFHQDCTRFYDEADLLVFPSHAEGQGLVPLEAMGRGLPCLVSDIDAVMETVDQGRCAAVFRVGDVDDLVRQVEALRSDPTQRAALSVAGLARVREHYMAHAAQESYFELVQQVLGEGQEQA